PDRSRACRRHCRACPRRDGEGFSQFRSSYGRNHFAAPRLLSAFPQSLSEVARRSLADAGVKVLVNSEVRLIDADGVIVHDRRFEARTFWGAAGAAAPPAAKWLNSEADKAGRVKVQPDLSVAHLPDVYVIGDTALANCWKGEPVPGLAPAAKQGGAFVAKVIRAKL